MQQEKNKKGIVEEGYLIPENYFIEHKLKVMSRIEQGETKNIKIVYGSLLKKSLLVAASLLLLLMLFPEKEEGIGAEDLISYVESTGIDTWEEEMMIDMISLEEIKNERSEELINYLEDTDLETILENI